MGRRKINFDRFLLRLPEGMMAWIKRGLQPGETVADFIRLAIEAALDVRNVKKDDSGNEV